MTTGSLPRKSGSGRGEEPEVSMASWTVSPDTRKEAEPGPVTQETSVPVGAQKRYSGKTNRERHSRRTRPPSQTEGWGGWQERRERNWAWCCFSRSLRPVGRCSLTTWPWGLWSELGLSLGSALPQTRLEKGIKNDGGWRAWRLLWKSDTWAEMGRGEGVRGPWGCPGESRWEDGNF